MIAFPEMLIKPAEEAGIPVPSDAEDFSSDEFPHFNLFCCAQLGNPLPSPTSPWTNAKIIAKIPLGKVKTIKWPALLKRGFEIGYSKV